MDLEPGWERRWILRNASRLAELRKERRVSQNLIADEARLNASQVWRAERGRDIRLSTLRRWERREAGRMTSRPWR
jgi:transcriptional regulator with XRE-family HTH domain